MHKYLIFLLILLAHSAVAQKAERFNKRGLRALKKEKYSKALQYFGRALTQEPTFCEAYANTAKVYREQKNYLKAIRALDYAIACDSARALYYHQRAQIHRLAANPPAVVKDLKTTFRLSPQADSLLLELAAAQYRAKEYESAERNTEKYLKEHQEDLQARILLNSIKSGTGKLEEALQGYNKLIEEQPEIAVLWNNRADLYLQMEQYDKALEDADKAIALRPEYYISYLTKSEILFKMNKREQACKNLNMSILLGAEKAVPGPLLKELKAKCDFP